MPILVSSSVSPWLIWVKISADKYYYVIGFVVGYIICVPVFVLHVAECTPSYPLRSFPLF